MKTGSHLKVIVQHRAIEVNITFQIQVGTQGGFNRKNIIYV